MTLTRSSPVHVIAGFLAMGAWAAFANRNHPMPAPLLAFLVQGTISASITFGLKRVVEAVSHRTRGPAALVLPVLAAWGISFTLLIALHSLARTPELWTTIAVPNLVATTYAAAYAASLWRKT